MKSRYTNLLPEIMFISDGSGRIILEHIITYYLLDLTIFYLQCIEIFDQCRKRITGSLTYDNFNMLVACASPSQLAQIPNNDDLYKTLQVFKGMQMVVTGAQVLIILLYASIYVAKCIVLCVHFLFTK